MKKITYLFLLLLVKFGALAQVSTYGFTQSTEAYTAVSGTVSAATGDDGIENAIPIGFTFKYDGIDYTHFCISTNGWIKIGDASTTIGSSSWTNTLSNTAAHRPLIAPFWDDNHRNNGTISYAVTGTAPNRILEVGWDGVNIGGGGSTSATNVASYKLRIYETTNVIEFVYGPTMASAGTLTASVGLNGGSTFLSVTPAASATVSSATANNAISSTTNLVGKKYIFTPPACLAPTGISASAVTTTSATVSWTAPSPAPASGYEYVVSTSNVAPAGSGTASATTSISATGLTSSTNYYIFVRSNCGGSFSAWNGPVNFTTLCTPGNIPYAENFESVTPPALPICTSVINSGSGNVWSTYSNPGAGFTTKVLRYTYNSTNAADTWFFTKALNLTAGTSYRITYNYGNDSTFYVEDMKVAYGLNADAASMTTVLADHPGINQSAIQYNSVDFTPSATGIYYFGFQAYSAADMNHLLLDNITVDLTPSCETPTALTAANITNAAADLSWTASISSPSSGYQYVLSTSNTAPAGAGTPVAGTSVSVSGLSGNTTYYLFVRANCGASFSAWAGPYSFTTLCDPIATLPWTENFDALATVGTTSFPGCWYKENGDWATSVANSYATPRSGANFLRDAWGATDEYMWTPGFNLVAGTSYDFSAFVQGDNGDDWTVDMYYNSTSSSAGATALGATYAVPGTGSPYAPQGYNEMRRTFVPSTSGTYYFAVKVNEPSSNPWYISFDDFKLELTPACSSPNPTASNITPNTADLSWTTVTGLNYEYVLDTNAADPAGAGTSTAGTSYSASSLTAGTTYYFHVRNNCGGSGFSTWSTTSFTTLPNPPANDNCGGAITLIPAVDFATGAVTGTLVGATDSEVADPSIPAPGCASYVGHDVWYSVTVPATGSITVETGDSPSSAITDTGIAVYTGACGALVLGDCDDDTSLNGAFSLITLDGTTTPAVAPGDLLYVRVWRYNSTATTKNIAAAGEFRIAAYDPALSTSSFDLKGFRAYPNPVKDVFNISYTKEITSVSVLNLLGQEVLNKKINALQSSIDMSGLSNGAYLVKVNVDGLVSTIKVVKQ